MGTELAVERPDIRRRDALGRFGRVAVCRSPARQRLFDAQVSLLSARQAAEANERGRARAFPLVEAAESKLATAKKQAVAARQRQADLVADAAVSGASAGVDTSARAGARAAVVEAQDDLDAVTAAQSRLLARQKELDDAVISARNELASSVDGVLIAEAAARAFEEAKAALAHLLGARCVLRAVCAKSRLEGDWRQTSRAEAVRKQAWADAGLGDDGADVWRHLDWSLAGLAERDENADAAPWRAAREALFVNADAPLPAD
jgi:hypothetical protein